MLGSFYKHMQVKYVISQQIGVSEKMEVCTNKGKW